MTPGRPGLGKAGCRAGRAGRPVPRGVRAARPWTRPPGRLGWPADNGGHLRVAAVVPRGRFLTRDMHDAPFGPRRRGRGVSRMPRMPDRPRPTGIASNVASCMPRDSRGLPTGTPHPPPDARRWTQSAQKHRRTLKTTATAAGHGRPAERPHGCRAQRGPITGHSTSRGRRMHIRTGMATIPAHSRTAGGRVSTSGGSGAPRTVTPWLLGATYGEEPCGSDSRS